MSRPTGGKIRKAGRSNETTSILPASVIQKGRSFRKYSAHENETEDSDREEEINADLSPYNRRHFHRCRC